MPDFQFTQEEVYETRTNTYASGDQVAAAALNGIQDGIIDLNTAIDALVAQLNDNAAQASTATGNQADSPAPAVGGARTVWAEMITNDTTVVVIDNSIDWRDRYVFIRGTAIASANDIAGGSADNAITHNLDVGAGGYLHALFYSRNGQDGTASTECREHTISGGNVLRFFARDSDGALCFRRTTSGSNYYFLGELVGSPIQNHY